MKKFNWQTAARYEVNAVFRTPELPPQIVKCGSYGKSNPRICECCHSLVEGTCFDDISVIRDREQETAELFREARCRHRFAVSDSVELSDETPIAETGRNTAVSCITRDDNSCWTRTISDTSSAVTLSISTNRDLFAPGTRVHARWKGGSFYPGKVQSITMQGDERFYSINFDDGDYDPICPLGHVKLFGTEIYSPDLSRSFSLDEIFLEVRKGSFVLMSEMNPVFL